MKIPLIGCSYTKSSCVGDVPVWEALEFIGFSHCQCFGDLGRRRDLPFEALKTFSPSVCAVAKFVVVGLLNCTINLNFFCMHLLGLAPHAWRRSARRSRRLLLPN